VRACADSASSNLDEPVHASRFDVREFRAEVEPFFNQCHPEQDNLCLYGSTPSLLPLSL
jgi:Alfin